jgi:hypothetical protein
MMVIIAKLIKISCNREFKLVLDGVVFVVGEGVRKVSEDCCCLWFGTASSFREVNIGSIVTVPKLKSFLKSWIDSLIV